MKLKVNTDKAMMAAKSQTAIIFYRAFVGFLIFAAHRFCCLCIGLCGFIIRKLIVDNRQSMGNSAQQGRVLWKQKHFEMDETSPFDFLCFFISRLKPDSVLRPNVSLYALTDKEAIFVETAENVNIYSSKVHTFFFVAQFLHAKNIIKMSIKDFVSLAEKIGDPTVPVSWISNTGRCGGTLLCQMFESVPGTLVIHEPDTPLPLWHLQAKGALNDSQYEVMLKSSIRFLTCTNEFHDIKRIFIKPRPQCPVLINDITRLLPSIRHLFMYRNSLDTIKSWLKAVQCEPFPAVIYSCTNSEWFSKICPYFRQFQRYYMTPELNNIQEIPADANTACLLACKWASFILTARDVIAHDPNILPVKYEDILARPQGAVRQLFDSLGIDDIHVDNAVTYMERDSQKGSVMSCDRLAQIENTISPGNMIRIDAIFSKFNLPSLGKDFRI